VKQEKSVNNNFKIIKSVLIGSIFGIAVCSAFLCLFAFIFVQIKQVPHLIVMEALVLISVAFGAFFSGYISVRILKEKGLLCGMISGIFLFFILLLSGISIENEPFSFITLSKCLIAFFFGAIGGVLGVNRRLK